MATQNSSFRRPGGGTWFNEPQQSWSRANANRTGHETDNAVAAKYRTVNPPSSINPHREPARPATSFEWTYGDGGAA
jgi:hypothetical protein